AVEPAAPFRFQPLHHGAGERLHQVAVRVVTAEGAFPHPHLPRQGGQTPGHKLLKAPLGRQGHGGRPVASVEEQPTEPIDLATNTAIPQAQSAIAIPKLILAQQHGEFRAHRPVLW
ncbi:MAG: hypothetical protein ACK55I_36030, partial [bacterium]